MNIIAQSAAAAAVVSFAASSLAVWGVRYEVNSGSGWSSSTTVNVLSGAKSVDFRIIVYHDGTNIVVGSSGTGTALSPSRLVMSQRLTSFGNQAWGDDVVTLDKSVLSGNAAALEQSTDGQDLILGRPNSILSFTSNLGDTILNPRPQRLELEFFHGTILIGNNLNAALNRTINLTANSFAYPNAANGTGGPFGASFYVENGNPVGIGAVQEAGITLSAQINVIPAPAALSLFSIAMLPLARRRSRN